MPTARAPIAPIPRAVSVAGFILVIALIVTLSPGMTRVEAAGLFGGLRSPGHAAFVAGHRGDRTAGPENTMPALQAALDGPMEFVETDVHLSADGVPVLIHDFFVDRTTNGTGRVDQHTVAQLQALDAGSWFDPAFSTTRIPTLATFLDALAATAGTSNQKKCLLELKGYWSTDEAAIVLRVIEAAGVRDQVILASFDTSTLQHVRELDASLPTVIITSKLPADPVAHARLYGAVAIVTSRSSIEADPWVVDRMHRAGLGIVLYTLNTKDRWEQAMELGVDGIITDKPGHLQRWFAAADVRAG